MIDTPETLELDEAGSDERRYRSPTAGFVVSSAPMFLGWVGHDAGGYEERFFARSCHGDRPPAVELSGGLKGEAVLCAALCRVGRCAAPKPSTAPQQATQSTVYRSGAHRALSKQGDTRNP